MACSGRHETARLAIAIPRSGIALPMAERGGRLGHISKRERIYCDVEGRPALMRTNEWPDQRHVHRRRSAIDPLEGTRPIPCATHQ